MKEARLGAWLRWLRGTATFVYVAALCLAVAVLVIGLVPGSPVTQALPSALLSGLDGVRGVVSGVVVDPGGSIAFKISDPSPGQRMIYVTTMLPGLVLVAEIARRMARLLGGAQDSDPFTARTVHDLTAVAKVTVAGGLAVWVLTTVAHWALSATMLPAGTTPHPDQSILGWLAVGLVFAGFAQLIARGVAMRRSWTP